jgi:hypothetical protein
VHDSTYFLLHLSEIKQKLVHFSVQNITLSSFSTLFVLDMFFFSAAGLFEGAAGFRTDLTGWIADFVASPAPGRAPFF